jgi:hypothetical protein
MKKVFEEMKIASPHRQCCRILYMTHPWSRTGPNKHMDQRQAGLCQAASEDSGTATRAKRPKEVVYCI